MELVAAAAIGFVAGVLAGLFGVGGGILFVPTLGLVLGLTQLHAEASSLLAILPTVAAGTLGQQRYGHVRWGPALVVGTASIVGVEIGVRVAHSLSDATLRRSFAVLMVVVAGQIAWRARRA